ncbi:hypothetical protein G9A89_006341 [Geosiphon pyriformis]|nr:hypothetical protein G9A89_006341 [Geosiphon pyriformis]
MNTPKDIIITVVSKFREIKLIKIQLIGMWQKAVVEFVKLDQADLLASKWSFLIDKNSVHIAKAVRDYETWTSKDWFRALLFTLPVGTITYNLKTLLERAGGKTCIINRSVETGNRTCCAVVGFDSDNDLEFAFCMEPILSGCERYGKFGHSALECDTPVVSIFGPLKTFKRVAFDEHHFQLTKLYEKKSVPIFCPVVLLVGFFNSLCFTSGSGSLFSGTLGLNGGIFFISVDNLSLDAHLASLKQSLKLLTNQVSSIVCKLNKMELVLQVLPFSSKVSAVLVTAKKDLTLNIVVNGLELVLSPLSFVFSSISVLGQSSSKVLITKIGSLESKLVVFEASVGSVLAKLDYLCAGLATCNVWGINVPAKQEDVVCWHKKSSNMVSIITETKLKPSIRPWIMNKFKSMCIFTFGLDSGFLGTGIEKVPSHIVLVHLFFMSRVLVLIIGLYACAFSSGRLEQTFSVNSFIAWVVNFSSFVVLSGNFNECSSKKSASYEFCLSLGLSNLKNVEKVIDHILISKTLILAVTSHKINSVSEFFDTNYKAISVLVDLGGLLDEHFMEYSVGKFLKKAVDFHVTEHNSDLNNMWNIFREVVFESTRNKLSSKFYRLELLVFKIFSSLNLGLSSEIDCLVGIWASIDGNEASRVCVIINKSIKVEDFVHHILVVKRDYHRSKYHEFKVVKNDSIRKTVIKSSIDTIMENWTRKYLVTGALLDDDTFSGVMSNISMEELLWIIRDLPDNKAVGLSGIPNEL